jgi:UDP-2,3-diacylglucosamine pyrophosphatase LpxH
LNKYCFEKRIEYKYGDEIKIKPLFDIHYGNALCDVRALKDFLADSDDKTYFIGGGDWMDSIIVTDKRYRKSIDPFDSEEIVDEQIDGLYNILEPYKDRILSCGEGNHEDTIVKKCGTNPSKRLAEKLGVPYTGYSCFFKINLTENGGRGRTVVIYLHHGYGGGSRTQGADLTKYAKTIASYDADIYLYGHTHKLQSDEIPRLGIVGNKLVSKPKILVVCGTFKKSLGLNNETTFEEVMGFPPTKMGGATINIKPTREWVSMSVSL